jgi:nucleoid-associated protein YgaU
MTERGLPSVDGAPACPFVAFEDDRESRSTSPDHRHRCYAEPLPAPRAAAHQEAYCLSSAFPVCPTFQEWARREAAHARGDGERPALAPVAIARASVSDGGHEGASDEDAEDDDPGDLDEHRSIGDRRPLPPPIEEPQIHRNPPRDWAAPPPWASGGAGASGAGSRRSAVDRSSAEDDGPPQFLADRPDESRGWAGSAAHRLASGAGASDSGRSPVRSSDLGTAALPDAELAELVGPARAAGRPVHGYPTPPRPGNRPRVSSTRSEPPRDAIIGPAWERQRRFEAYPSIRTRVGLPSLPRVAVLAIAVAIAAVGLFFLPALLGVGGSGDGDSGSATPSVSHGVASASPAPSVLTAPTSQVYVIKAGDTLSKVAKRFGLTLQELLAANKDTITNPDKITIGDEIVIPTVAPDVINDGSPAPSSS